MESLIVFARAPLQGKVKKRLESTALLDPEIVCKLYESFLKDTVNTALSSKAKKVSIHYTPEGSLDLMRSILPDDEKIEYQKQEGETFADRIDNSFKLERKLGGLNIIMIGSDIPLIRASIIDEGFSFLSSSSKSALIGPSTGSGIYLIGIGKGIDIDCRDLFDKGSEFENLVNLFISKSADIKLMETVSDIDIAEDLAHLIGLGRYIRYQNDRLNENFMQESLKLIDQLKIMITTSKDDNRQVMIKVGR